MVTIENKKQIQECEKKLLDAFGKKDLKTIDELIHDDALFVYPNGLPVTKAQVIENYRTGNSAFTTIIPGDQTINLFDDSAVVSLNLELKGNYHQELISAEFRYIRVWKLFNGKWQIIAVSGVPISKQ
ncbi:MAG TPA: nuclear transport factor 2 family protein [Nitrosopumilaceae archaeon]|nr:nuclear transport factor 2 family protein [Nitrosopumilaceae archaeon]